MKDTTIAKRQNGNPAATFGNVVDDIFENSLKHFFDDNFWDNGRSLTKSVNVPVNVRETEDRYEVDVIAPGCRKEDFKISINDNLLTVSFTHADQQQEQDQKHKWVRNEFVQRSFSRSFNLDDTVDVNNINATYTDGILRLSMAKNEKAKTISRNIEIN
jgi:HSP20 family protein